MLKNEKRKSRKNIKLNLTPAAFLSKTYEIIENPEYKDIVAWTSDGTAFVIKKPNEFSDKILPKYFKHNNMASFVRQLNMYDFHKCRNKNNENEFKHKMFLRGQKHLLADIKRKTNETNGIGGGLEESDEGETDKEQHKKEYSMIFQEVFNLKKKQENLENAVKILVSQNKQIISENMCLWSEIIKRQDAHDKKVDKLLLSIFTYFGKSNLPHNLPLGIKEGKDNIMFDVENEKRVKKETKEDKSDGDEQERKSLFKNQPNSVMCLVQNNKAPNTDIEKMYKKFMKNYNNKKKKNESSLDYNSLMNSYKNNVNVLQSVMDYVDSDTGSTIRNLDSADPLNPILNGKRPFQPSADLETLKSLFDERAHKKSKKNPKRKDFAFSHEYDGEMNEGPLNMSFLASGAGYNPYIDFYDYGKNESLFQNHHPQVKMGSYIPQNNAISMITNYPNNANSEVNNNLQSIKHYYNHSVENFGQGSDSPYFTDNHNGGGLYIQNSGTDGRALSPNPNVGLMGINQLFPLENNQKAEDNAMNMFSHSPKSDFGLAMRRKNSLFETHSTGKWSDDENYKLEMFEDQNGLSPAHPDNNGIKSVNGRK